MKSVLIAIVAAFCAHTLNAAGSENAGKAAFSELSGMSEAVPVPPAAPAPLTKSAAAGVHGNPFCWSRGKDIGADRLGMPDSFCIRSMEFIPGFNEVSKLEIKGDVLNGIFDLKLGQQCDGFFKATAIIFSRVPMVQVCAPAEAAYIELDMLVDERGTIVSDPAARSFYGETSDACDSEWNYREIKYISKI
jgi:hypothetical protein